MEQEADFRCLQLNRLKTKQLRVEQRKVKRIDEIYIHVGDVHANPPPPPPAEWCVSMTTGTV